MADADIRLEILSPGLLAVIEDLGRPGLAHLGVSRSGAADRRAHRLANRLVANPDDRATVEVTLGGWDMHNTMWEQGTLPTRAGILDRAVGALMTDLESLGLLEETVIVVTTEFGRSPQINYNAGRDHHPAVFSALVAGGGIKGGQVYGSSDKRGHLVDEDGVSPADLNATVATALGLKLDEVIHSPTGRPFKVAHDGAPVKKLLS